MSRQCSALFRDFVGAAKATLPEGAQRALPLNGGLERREAEAAVDRVLAITHD